MLVVAAISALLVVGMRESARVNNVLVAIKLVIIVVFIAAAAPFVTTAHWVTASNPDGAFHSAQRRSRPIRLERRAARRRRGVLRLYRLRRGVDGGAGGEESEARHADRHPRLARHLHHSLRRGRLRAHRHRALRQAQRARSDCHRHRRRGPVLAFADPQIRHHPRSDLGHSGHAVGPAADVLFDGARRLAAARRRHGAQPVPHALCHDADRPGSS